MTACDITYQPILWGFLSPVLAVTWVDVVRLDHG
jgi:hypothetical protein